MDPPTPALARRQLRLAAVAALQAANTGATIDSPGDWTTPTEKLPAILVRTTRGTKESIIKGPPEFTSVIVIELESRVGATTKEAAQDAIEALDYAIECAIFTNQALISLVNQFPTVDTDTEITSEARLHFGATKWAIRCEVPEMFDPFLDAPASLQPVASPLQGSNFHVDLAAPFDATGTYPNPAFPGSVLPAPRQSGPDGRDEGYFEIQLPQS